MTEIVPINILKPDLHEQNTMLLHFGCFLTTHLPTKRCLVKPVRKLVIHWRKVQKNVVSGNMTGNTMGDTSVGVMWFMVDWLTL